MSANDADVIIVGAGLAGLPGVIQHGMLTMAQIGLLFSPHLEHGYIKRFRTRFSGMVQLGDQITIAGRVTGKEEYGDGTLYTFAVSAKNAGERAVAMGTVEFLTFIDGAARTERASETSRGRSVRTTQSGEGKS